LAHPQSVGLSSNTSDLHTSAEQVDVEEHYEALQPREESILPR
jgi:hypothetical protein